MNVEAHVQVHTLKNGFSVIRFTITTYPEGNSLSKATSTGTGSSTEPVEYTSIEAAREHWEHLVSHGWIVID